jgi:hypothetical protein
MKDITDKNQVKIVIVDDALDFQETLARYLFQTERADTFIVSAPF